jgi:hypothetical protein
MKEKTIGERYGLRATEEQKKGYSLEQWYAALTEKTEEELEPVDVMRMCRQNILPELAAKKAIEYLQNDPLNGELWPGEFLESVVRFPVHFIPRYRDELRTIVSNGRKELERTDLLMEEEKEEYADTLMKVEKMI